jgi:hypothetical protein
MELHSQATTHSSQLREREGEGDVEKRREEERETATTERNSRRPL